MKRPTPAERQELAGLGRAVRHLRTSKGIGRSAFVAASGIGWDRVAAIENDEFDPTYDELLALACGLRVTPAELVGRADAEAKDGDA
jgi:transcriptional regulator with XRE-family HTH domain